VKALEKKASKRTTLEQLLKDAFRSCLVAPLAGAMLQGRQRSCTALTQSWLVYIRRQQVIALPIPALLHIITLFNYFHKKYKQFGG
jgi:hypothetical protein